MDRAVTSEGCLVRAEYPPGRLETYYFKRAEEARKRAVFVSEALSWVGTPFVDCADIKGPKGSVDCAMMLTRCVVDTGLIPAFDPRPYSPQWLLHKNEEKMLDWMRQLGAVEVASPMVGDVVVYKFGRTFAHMGVLANSEEIVHAYKAAGMCLISRLDETLLRFVGIGNEQIPRPVKYFDLFRGG